MRMRPQRGGRIRREVKNGMSTPTMTWTRLARALGSDHNPLRRRFDVIAAWLTPAAVAIFLILAPLVVTGAVLWAHAVNAATSRAERDLHPVTAVLQESVPGPLMTANGANSWLTWVHARWTADGQARAGLIPAVSGSPAGATVPVWLDPAGHVQIPPLTAAQARDRVITAATAALAVLAVVLAGLGLVARCVINRKRLAAWEAAWQLTGPRWRHLA
jgi:hypothetical protein